MFYILDENFNEKIKCLDLCDFFFFFHFYFLFLFFVREHGCLGPIISTAPKSPALNGTGGPNRKAV